MMQYEKDNEHRSLFAEGRAEFDQARFAAFWTQVRDLLMNRPVGLLSFDEVKDKLHLSEQIYRGLQEIPLDSIVGSVGRYRDFTRNFLPKSNEMIHRWSTVYAHMNDMTGVPPIDVYKVDDVYFVQDGNHRVSIARQLGNETIEAYVTEIKTPIHLNPNMTRKDLSAAEAYGAFLERTSLNMNRPQQEAIQLSEPDRYNDLISHIHLVQRLMAHQRGYDVSFEQAAMRWYDTLYAPVIKLIRECDILKAFPRRTEADLYVWVIWHFQQMLEAYGEDSDELTISNAMVDFLAAHNLPVPKRILTTQNIPIG
ncbi:MAG: hypothetical protein AAFV33_28330 [Chloroflexota bacterium]